MNDEKKIIKKESKKKDFILTFSDNTQLFVDEETYFKNYIYSKETMSDLEINDIKDKTEISQCFKRATTYLLNGKKTENRLSAYLINKGFSIKAVNNTIKRLKKDEKINDLEFVKKFIHVNLKSDTKREKLIAKLIYHGVDQELAEKEVDKVIKYEDDTY